MRAVSVVALCVVAGAWTASGQQYTDRYDNINLDEVLNNRRLLVPYVRCILDLGRCTAEGKELRSHIADALQTGCSKCTSAQRGGSKRVIRHLINHEQVFWSQLVAKYDPKRIYVEQYEKELRAIQQ